MQESLSKITAHNFVFASGADLLDVWWSGTLDAAAIELHCMAETQNIHVVGSIKKTLLEAAYKRFKDGDELYPCHIAALLDAGLISRR